MKGQGWKYKCESLQLLKSSWNQGSKQDQPQPAPALRLLCLLIYPKDWTQPVSRASKAWGRVCSSSQSQPPPSQIRTRTFFVLLVSESQLLPHLRPHLSNKISLWILIWVLCNWFNTPGLVYFLDYPCFHCLWAILQGCKLSCKYFLFGEMQLIIALNICL